jgi:hypothetical protein
MRKLVGERRALAAAVLGFYMSIFFVNARVGPGELAPLFGGMTGVYGAAFVGLVAGYFWARWFAVGLGISAVISTIIGLFQIGLEPMLLVYGGTHAAISLALWGGSMAAFFDGRTDWRERFHLDEHAVNRLGKSVIRVGVSLPYIVAYALAPRDSMMASALGALALAGFGAWALMRLRTWGVLALAGAAALTAVSLLSTPAIGSLHGGYSVDLIALGLGATLLLAAAVAPFLAPVGRYVRER